MLLLFTMLRQFFSRQIANISSSACAVFSAHITLPPRFVKACSKFSSCWSSVSIAFHLIFLARSRARCKSLNCVFPCTTALLYFPILKFIFRRWSISPALTVLFAIKVELFSVIIIFLLLAFALSLFNIVVPACRQAGHSLVLQEFY